MSESDAKWTESFHREICPDKKADVELSSEDLVKGLAGFEDRISQDPAQRTFAGLKRSANGAYSDADLVNILVQSVEQQAGTLTPLLIRLLFLLFFHVYR